MRIFEWKIVIFAILIAFLMASTLARADEFTSVNFKVLDPVLSPGTYSTSSSFNLNSAVSQIAIGTSTAANFNVWSGFLYYPAVSPPSSVSATAGDGQAALSWTAAAAQLGWTVAGYNVGQSTVSGGAYSYNSVGNVTSSTRAGLSNGTTYYFVIRAEDAFGNSIATSTEVSATPVAAKAPALASGGGGNGMILDILRKLVFQPYKPFAECETKTETDMNCDGKINLQDLSIFLFLSSDKIPSPADFNNDEKVDIKDLSMLFFDWTEKLLAFGRDDERQRGIERERPRLFAGIESREQLASVGSSLSAEIDGAAEETEISGKSNIIRRIGQFLFNTLKKMIGFFWNY